MVFIISCSNIFLLLPNFYRVTCILVVIYVKEKFTFWWEMYRIEPCRRGKISQAALFVKTVRMVQKRTHPPCFALQSPLPQRKYALEQNESSAQFWSSDRQKNFRASSSHLSFCMSGLPDCYEGTCSTMSIKRVYVVAVYLMLVY